MIIRDITERKGAETAMAEKEAHLRTILASAPITIFALDDQGRFSLSEGKGLERVGLKPGENVGVSALKLFGSMPFIEAGDKATTGGDIVRRALAGETVNAVSESQGFFFDLHIGPIRDPEGKVVGAVGTAADITEWMKEKRINEARLRLLKISETSSLEELLRATLDELETLTGSSDGFYHFLESDERTLSLQAWSSRTLRSSCRVKNPATHYDLSEAGVWADCVRLRRPVVHNDYAALPYRRGTPAGHVVVIREVVVPVFRGDRIRAVLGAGNKPDDYSPSDVETMSKFADIAWDLAERKRIERELRESEARYRAVVEDQTEVISRFRADGTFTFVNDVYGRFFGKLAEDLIGRSWKPAAVGEDLPRIEEKLRTLSPANPVVLIENRVFSGKGEVRWMQFVNRGIFDKQGQLIEIQSVGRDITERKRAEEELRKSREELRALAAKMDLVREEEKAHIAREIHDELGQRLTGLIMDLSLLSRRIPGSLKPLKEKIEEMTGEAGELVKTVRRISTDLRPGILDDLGLIAAIEWQTEDFEARTGIQCSFESKVGPEDLEPGHAIVIFRILQEALTNVARHAGARRVGIELKKDAGGIHLRIEDDGVGITPEKILDPRSLGLAGLRERARLLGGEVEIRGGPGKGTTVELRIPEKKFHSEGGDDGRPDRG